MLTMQNIQNELKTFARELGADVVGFCTFASPPTPLAPNLTHAVTLGVKLSDAILSTIENEPTFAYFQHYRAANALLDSISFRLARKIETLGFAAFPIAASQSQGKNNPYRGVIPHKTAAVLAGLGFVGKSGLFLSTEYGSRIRLATVLTDLPVQSERPVIANGCGDCTRCKDACPAGAIFGEIPNEKHERNIDPEKCSTYMKMHFQDIGRGSVCGVCIKVCPKNQISR